MNNEKMPRGDADHARIQSKQGRLSVDVSVETFPKAFSKFSAAAEQFAMGLSDILNRKFAWRYLEYLQETARGLASDRPNVNGARPACRLIRSEMDRLFKSHFFRPDELVSDRI